MMPQQQQEGTLFAMVLELTTAARHHGRPARGRRRPIGGLSDHRRAGVPHVGTEQGRGRPDARGGAVAPEPGPRRGGGDPEPIQFHDVVTEALVFPTNLRDPNAPAKVAEHAQRYYEETWIHQPRRSLAGNTPIDAAAHGNLRKKLRGVVEFIQDCATGSLMAGYDFDRLRRKLGLTEAPGRPTSPNAQAREVQRT